MAIRRSSSRSRSAPVPPESTPAPKPAPKVPQPGAEHYTALLPTYWARPVPVEALNSFVKRVRADCSAEDIRNVLLPHLPAASLGTTGIQIARLRAALERVAKE